MSHAKARPRIVVLASGGGTNCQALLDAAASGALAADIVAVVSNRANAGVLDRARSAGVDTHVVEHRGSTPDDRARGDRNLVELLSTCSPELVVLAGWMRILGTEVAERFPIINLHPAKPGEFAGVRAIERAFDSWKSGEIGESGVMVHWVPDAGVDIGPVIVTDSVRFEPGDTLDVFGARVHAVEHRLIVRGATLALRELGSA